MKSLYRWLAGLSAVVATGLCIFNFLLPSVTFAADGYANQPVTCSKGQVLLDSSYAKDRVCCPSTHATSASDCFYGKYVNPGIKVLSAVAGVAVLIGILYGSIQYASSGGDPQKTAQGKSKITKSLVGLVAFMFLYSALQFMSPGGIKLSAPTASGSTIAQKCTQSTFLGLKPWFYYLPDENFNSSSSGATCNIDNFELFPTDDAHGTKTPPIALVALAIADDLVRLAGMVAVAFVIVGGVQYVTSQGEPDRTKRARETIINALIGVVVAIVAAGVVSYVGQKLSGG